MQHPPAKQPMSTPKDPAEHLEPWRWKPGQSGNPAGGPIPAWRRELLDVLGGDGRVLWEMMLGFALGAQIEVRVKLVLNEQGDLEVHRLDHPRVLTPSESTSQRAAEHLLDKAFGKAVQAILTKDITGDQLRHERGMALIEDATPEDVAVIRRLAQRQVLRAQYDRDRASNIESPEEGGDDGTGTD